MRYLFLLICLALSNTYPNPLNNLTKEEIQLFRKLVSNSGKFSKEVRYSIVSIEEPPKSQILEGTAERILFGSLQEPKMNKVFHVRVNPKKKEILNVQEVPGVQPPISNEDFERLSKIVKSNSGWQEAVKRRGFSNFNELYVDGWAPGLLTADEKNSNLRLMRGVTYFHGNGLNAYARPLEGLVVTVDLLSEKVVSISDTENPPVPVKRNEIYRGKEIILPQNPVVSTQIGGDNIKIEGQKVKWFQWEFQFNYDPIHALQLFHVSFQDKGKLRPVLYKLSLSEMVVPYGDTAKNWSFRSAFDVGEYGLGVASHSLRRGIEVPSHARLFDFVYANESGKPETIPGALGIYERSQGILWTHLNMDTKPGHRDTMKNQELVITFISVVGNYDYGLSYIFHQDGTIEVQAQLTGILLAKGSTLTKAPCDSECNPLVERNILAPPHQHFFNFRIDLDVDTYNRNTPVEVNTEPIIDKNLNPYLNGFEKVHYFINSEKEGMRNLDLTKSRMWKIQSNADKNSLKHPTGYMLIPGENSVTYLQEDSQTLRRAQFLKHHVWFTKYKDNEQKAAGMYPNQSPGDKGLPEYISDDENLEDTDIVMWYTLGVTHHPRPEEWPIMSIHKTGFKLVPVHFFNRNPTAP